MTTKIRWGIVGTGAVAKQFAADFRYVQNAQLLAVASRTQRKAEQFARQFGISRCYGSYTQMLQDNGIDVVYIATPHFRHKEDCLQAFAANKAVLCEKPFALNAAEAAQIIQAARTRRAFCMEAMWMRFMPLIKEVKGIVDRGEIGEIRQLHANFGYPADFDPENRFFSRQQGGGSLLDRGIYPISLAFYLLGRPSAVSGEALLGGTGVDESSSYRLDYQQGATAHLFSSLRQRSSNEAFIFGTKGWIHIQEPFYRPETITIHSGVASDAILKKAVASGLQHNAVLRKLLKAAKPIRNVFSSGINRTISIPGNGYQFEIEEVSRCLQQNMIESQTMPLDETLAIIKTMDVLRQKWGLYYPQEADLQIKFNS